MASTNYYRCDGQVSSLPDNGLQCSTGWINVDEPVYTLISQEQTSDLIGVILLLIATWAVFKIILNTMGIKL